MAPLLPACQAESAYDFSLVKMDGTQVSLSTYKGKVLLIVNLARDSSFNDQLVPLDKLARTYQDKGLVILGIPANDFGAQEPGTDAEIRKVYTGLHLGFLVVDRISVRGKDQAPLYGFLTAGKDKALGGDVHWNFTKFVVDRTGEVVARLAPDVDPASPQMKMTLEKILDGTFKRAERPQENTSDEKDANGKEEDDDRDE